jgi:hypothetical protein
LLACGVCCTASPVGCYVHRAKVFKTVHSPPLTCCSRRCRLQAAVGDKLEFKKLNGYLRRLVYQKAESLGGLAHSHTGSSSGLNAKDVVVTKL